MGNKFGLTAAMKVDVDFNTTYDDYGGPHSENLLAARACLDESPSLLSDLQCYHGNADVIRNALSNSHDVDLQRESFSALRPNIDTIKKCHLLSIEFSQLVSDMAEELESLQSVKDNITSIQLMSDIFLFAFEFDQLKMLKPEIQNDFSFYRRSLGTAATTNEVIPVSANDANGVSMWLADSLPMMTSLCKALKSHPNMLVHMAHISFGMLARKVPMTVDDKAKLVKLMVVASIMYDRVCNIPGGVFVSQSPINIKKCIRIMKRDGGSNKEQLAQCIKYSTLHYNDGSTPNSIRRELERI